jgi:hypothetical protein
MGADCTSSDYPSIAYLSWVSRLAAFSQNTGRRTRMTPTVGPALAAAHRVRDGVLALSSDVWSDTHVAHPAGLADVDVLVVRIAQLTYRCSALLSHHAHLAAGQH